MIGLIVFLIIVFMLAAGFAWLADQPGSLLVLKLGGFEFAEENLAIIAAIAFAILLAIIFIWIVITAVWKTPGNIGGFFQNRRREKGWRAVAEGVIAVGSGDVAMARRSAKNSVKFLPEEPVSQLLTAQAAQMNGKSDEARQAFETMVEKPDTKVLGLRGLYMEAEATGEAEAARHFVEQAVAAQPGLEWSGKALLAMQAGEEDWEGALVTLHQNTDAKLYTKKEAKRLRAVLLTAFAAQLENRDPQKAKEKALEAHRLAPELVPATAIAARLLSRLGDLRKATKIIEASWKLAPHPDLMDAYTHVRAGDSGMDRLKRAEALNVQRANHPEGIMGVARAKMDVQDWDGARAALSGLLKSAPTERVCLLMADIEEAQYGDRGRVREWLSRAVRAPRDPAWTADGYVADNWAPTSPISGELDAFEWRVPVENLGSEADLAIEEIPSGPRELPAAEALSAAAVSLVPINEDDNVTYLGEKAPVEDAVTVEVEDVAQDRQDRDDADSAEMEEVSNPEATDAEEEASKQTKDNVASVEDEALEAESDMPEAEPASVEVDSAQSVTDESTDKKPVDPITKPQIDDPGIKQGVEPPRKRFKLF